ncbi:MAG TPA: TetR/AcrR family transcriptional regulator [Dermatophilaceae bacterium]
MAEQRAKRRRQASAVGGTTCGSARDRLLAAAAECFYDHGVNGTGIDAITAAAGVAKMSLYNNFASKDDLVLAYLQAGLPQFVGIFGVCGGYLACSGA